MNTSCQSGLRHMRTTIPSALANRASARPAPCAHAFPGFPPPLRSIKRPKPLPAHPSLPPLSHPTTTTPLLQALGASPRPHEAPRTSRTHHPAPRRTAVHPHAHPVLRSRANPINPLLGGGAGPLPSPRYTSFALLPARHPPTSPGARHTFTLARSASPELRCTSHTRRPRSWVKVSSSHTRAFVATRHCVSTPPPPSPNYPRCLAHDYTCPEPCPRPEPINFGHARTRKGLRRRHTVHHLTCRVVRCT